MLSSHNWLRLISPDFNLRNLFTLNWEALGAHLQLALCRAQYRCGSDMPAYPYLLTDYATVLSVFTHHQWIGGIFIVGIDWHSLASTWVF